MTPEIHVFILNHENGESYDDYNDWVVGVFRTLKAALKHEAGLPEVELSRWGSGEQFLCIQEWRGTKHVATYDRHGKMTWRPES